jgi:hypothetical protein
VGGGRESYAEEDEGGDRVIDAHGGMVCRERVRRY